MRIHSLVALLAVVSAAEVARLILYGLPHSGLLSIAWAVVAAALLFALGQQSSDKGVRRTAALLPAVVLVCITTGLFAGIRRVEVPVAIASIVVLALPPLTTLFAVACGYPGVRARLGARFVPVVAATGLVAFSAAAVPAWDMVTLQRIARPDYSFLTSHAGCYRLSIGPWIPRSQPGHGNDDMAARVVRLDTTRGGTAFTGERAMTVRERESPMIRPGWLFGAAYWQPLDADRVSLVWDNGLHGMSIGLRRSGSGYTGRAEASTDVLSAAPSPHASVKAVPVSCTEVPADSARMPGAIRRARGPLYPYRVR